MNPITNSIYLRGNITKDPQLSETQSGRKLLKMTLLTTSTYTNHAGDALEEKQWHNVIAWGSTAELMEKLLFKGHEVAIFGKVTNRTYEDKEGQQRNISEVVVEDFLKLTR